jgi:hypothetical protein
VSYLNNYVRCKNQDGELEQQHRIVAERYLGRKLYPEEAVHHINRDRADNRIINLIVFETEEDHLRYHNCNNRQLRTYPRLVSDKKKAMGIYNKYYGIVLYGPFYAQQVIKRNKAVIKSKS